LEIESLKRISKEIRKNIIEAVYYAQSGHPGGSLSCVDILTVLYFDKMHIKKDAPNLPERDRFVLSKGHATPALYGTLAEYGFFSKEELKSFRKIDSFLQGHPDKNKVPGVDMTTGSLGHGLSVANGMAMMGKQNKQYYRVYCLVGDGEIEEGQIWEAAMTSAHYKLDNLCLIIDNNELQIDGKVENVMNVNPIGEKFKRFGFEVIEIDGHNYEEIIQAFAKAESIKQKPTAIVAHTVKGKGVSFMENQASWHGKAPKEEEYRKAMEELSEK